MFLGRTDRFCGPRLRNQNMETSGDFSTPFGTGADFDSSRDERRLKALSGASLVRYQSPGADFER